MRISTWIAIGLFAAVAAWLASGLVVGGKEEGEEQAQAPQAALVEVRTSSARQVPRYLYGQGVAEPFRTTQVISSVGGTLAEIEVQQGDVVEAGSPLAQVRLDARESQLASAEAQVESLEADLEALRELEGQGFATPSRVRALRSQLESARAELERVREEISDTTIEAPISGIVSEVFVNSGETAPVGTAIAQIVDNAPLRVALNISQRDIGSVEVGREALVSFATGELAKGRLCFVAPAADPQTRTFRVEIRVPNTERQIPSIVSTEVRFQTGRADAHFISPAILALSEEGELGVKGADEDNRVRFYPVDIVRTDGDGIWVGGLPERLRLITIGQGFVREGEAVRVREPDDGGEGASHLGIADARLPTATVDSPEFEGAEDIPDPPPAEELCRGTASNSVLTSSVPSGSAPAPAGQTSGTDGSGQAPAQPMQGAGGTSDAEGPDAQPPPQVPSIGPISPEIPTPSLQQPMPQPPGGATQQAPGGAAGGGMGAPSANPGGGASGSPAPPPGGNDGGGP